VSRATRDDARVNLTRRARLDDDDDDDDDAGCRRDDAPAGRER
jgi:hypothetical protein